MLKQCLLLSACAILLAPFVGCEDGGGGGAPTVDMTGTWDGLDFGTRESITATFLQSGSSVSGTWGSNFGSSGTFSGSVSGDSLSGTFTASDGYRITVRGSVNGDSMAGTWKSNGGDTGRFTGVRR